MRRETHTPRPDWRAKVEALGFDFHTIDGRTYWDESAAYVFSSDEIAALESAAGELHRRCLDAAEHVIRNRLYARLGIPQKFAPLVEASWERRDFSLYGRFDFAWDGDGSPKMLEYNADTPTTLLEAALVRRDWLREKFPGGDRFDAIHERLIDAWKRSGSDEVWFCSVSDHPEDFATTAFLADTAARAGVTTHRLTMSQIGWNPSRRVFTDPAEREMRCVFKLYPWEWLFDEAFGEHLLLDTTRWFEPPWKAILSSKGLLPILWELFPAHPNLLSAFTSPKKLGGDYARKPILSREGANITLVRGGEIVASNTGDYGAKGFVYQALRELPDFAGKRPVLGVWIVDHEPCGMGVREDHSAITGNLSRFVPHRIG